jgi:hypothetical protein
MGDIEKRLNKAAIKVGAAWGTEVDADAVGHGILPLNAGSPKLNVDMLEDESDTAFDVNLDVGNYAPSDFSLDFDYRWDGYENLLLGLLMGVDTAPSGPVDGNYVHTITLADKVESLFATYAVEKGTKIHICPSVKVLKWTLSGSGGIVKSSFNLRADRLIDTSAILANMATVTIPANAHHRAKTNQVVIRMNDHTWAGGGTALTAAIIKPKSFTLEVERKFDGEHTTGSATILEPIETDKPTVKLTMEFPRMDATNAAYFADWFAGTNKKADIFITGPHAGTSASVHYCLQIDLPRLIIEDVEYADSKVIPSKIVLRGAVSDMDQTTTVGVLPIGIFLTNTMSASLIVG